MASVSQELTTLQTTLGAAVQQSLAVPSAERPAFISRFLKAVHEERPQPTASVQPYDGNVREDLPALASTLTRAINIARGRAGWPMLALAESLMEVAGAPAMEQHGDTTAPTLQVTDPTPAPAGPAAAAVPAAAAPTPTPKKAGKYGALSSGIGKRSNANASAAGGRLPTYAALDRREARPKTMPLCELIRLESEVQEEGAQSAREARRAWSLTGGHRDSSFRKKPKSPTDTKKTSQSSVGFASVLSMSGWSEVDAELVDVGVGDASIAAGSAAGHSDHPPADAGDPYPSSDTPEENDMEGSLHAASFVKRRAAPVEAQ